MLVRALAIGDPMLSSPVLTCVSCSVVVALTWHLSLIGRFAF
ncbi:hypothetical protein [Streptomyces anulatus]